MAHHTATRGSTADHLHKVAASFSKLPNMEERPHVKIKVANTDFWALLDTGASISLVEKNAIAHIVKFINLKMIGIRFGGFEGFRGFGGLEGLEGLGDSRGSEGSIPGRALIRP